MKKYFVWGFSIIIGAMVSIMGVTGVGAESNSILDVVSDWWKFETDENQRSVFSIEGSVSAKQGGYIFPDGSIQKTAALTDNVKILDDGNLCVGFCGDEVIESDDLSLPGGDIDSDDDNSDTDSNDSDESDDENTTPDSNESESNNDSSGDPDENPGGDLDDTGGCFYQYDQDDQS